MTHSLEAVIAEMRAFANTPARAAGLQHRSVDYAQLDRWADALTDLVSVLRRQQEEKAELLAALRRICTDDHGHNGGRIIKGNDQMPDEAGTFYRGYNAGIVGQFNKTRDIAAAAIAKTDASPGQTAPPESDLRAKLAAALDPVVDARNSEEPR